MDKTSVEIKQNLNVHFLLDGMKYWKRGDEEEAPPHGDQMWRCAYPRPHAATVEMTAYALLAYAQKNQVQEGIPIMKWLVSQRNGNGGFASTQDTVIGLQSLAAFAAMVGASDSMDMEVSITAGSQSHRFETITSDNALILQCYEVGNIVSDTLYYSHLHVYFMSTNCNYSHYTSPILY